jgi:UDP-N-acetylmuramate: L-alanyl-gamma-D-glutamyl-meso-diaminopimelate ligase
LNNLEFDHADIFNDLAAIETQFHHLVRTVPQQGLIVANGNEPSLNRVIEKGCWTPVEKFGDNVENTWNSANEADDGSFDILLNGKAVGRLTWRLFGQHNRMNALASMAAARHAGVTVEVAIEALSQFENVKRRMEVRGEVNGVTVYDDFAHHPTAITTTVAGLRGKVGKARILAVLEPRSNTMKLGVMKNALPESLKDADLVFCYGANLGWDAAEALAPIKAKAAVYDDIEAMVTAIVQQAKAGDQVLVMSNGGFGGVHQKLLDALTKANVV